MNKSFDAKPVSELVRYAKGKVMVRGMSKTEIMKRAMDELASRGYDSKGNPLDVE